MDAAKPPPEPTVHDVIDAVWSEIRRVLGATMAASLFRRTIVDCGDSCGRLSEISITKNGGSYTYVLPPSVDDDPDIRSDLQTFVDCILGLLRRISGEVLVGILMKNPMIRESAGKEWSAYGES